MITPSQAVLTIFIFLVITRTFLAYKKGNFSKSFTTVWILFWLFVVFLVFQQNAVSQIAHSLGISRGVDLVIYLSLIAIFYFIYKFLGMLYEIDEKITKIVRKMALKEPKKKEKKKDG